MQSHAAKREHDGDVSQQKIKCRPIRIREIGVVTLWHGLMSCQKFEPQPFVERCSYDNDFWPINLGDLNIILGACNGFPASFRESCDTSYNYNFRETSS